MLQQSVDEPLKPMLEQVTDELRASHPDRIIETDFSQMAPVTCDRSRIGQLLSNLIANALTHGAEDGPIRVATSVVGGMFDLSVSNLGKPIPPETIKDLFKPFFRAAVRPSLQGLGLGLYIAAEIARAHGGTLSVASSAEETRFTFRMPVA
jgi:signal transduction histidine kinase